MTEPQAAPSSPHGVLLALSGDDSNILRALDAPGSGLKVVRRCADTPELLSAAMAGLATLVVTDTAFDDLDRTVLDRLRRAGAFGLLLAPDAERERWAGAGWPVESAETAAAGICARLQSIARGLEDPPQPPFPPAAPRASAPSPPTAERDLWDEFDAATPTAPLAPTPDLAPRPVRAHANEADKPRGRLVAVWGPQGAPGRSTIAAALAAGLSAGTILVDADTQAPCLTQLLGLPEDSSALATAARLASRGRLDPEALGRILIPVSEDRRLLSGLGRAGRWRELPAAAMPEVWEQCRRAAAWTVVDVSGGQVDDAVDDFTLEPGPGAVTAHLLRNADVVVIVGAGDPIGIRRLLQLIDDLDGGTRPTGRIEVVVNRVRASAAGPSPQQAVREALARFGGIEEVTLLPDDAATADRCLLEGRSVLEAAPGSPLGRALAELVDQIDPRSGARRSAGRAARGARLRRLTARRAPRRPRTAGASPSRTSPNHSAPGGGRPEDAASAVVNRGAPVAQTPGPLVGASTPAPPPPPAETGPDVPQAPPTAATRADSTGLLAPPPGPADSRARNQGGRHRA
ncbi:hypothetical protein CWT12_09115 [Actinomyces sp. 432]|uniref:AAA family ATPase n=1 Tax=Actinomyces sp. 432 TaxID=2057798 RepID=UPI001373B419|nr:hypothetical protein [Actinomyces sp. 432]QHO91434.1 hypothetical protein CWT12_09115 [Actinomyces sp. 432]